MKCLCSCGEDAVYVDDRPGANMVGWCRECMPESMWPLAEELTVKPAPEPAGDLEPTPAGKPTPVEGKSRTR